MNKAHIVVGMQYGDEGKGACVDFLVRQTNSKLVVRFDGGSQCYHRVVHGYSEHGFKQFGSGTLSGANTAIGPRVVIDPMAMEQERIALSSKGAHTDIFICDQCRVVTPYHSALNKIRELSRGKLRHGSCGFGIYEATIMKERITASDLWSYKKVTSALSDVRDSAFREANKLVDRASSEVANSIFKVFDRSIHDIMVPGYLNFASSNQIVSLDEITKLINREDEVVFEGNQGALIDGYTGFLPYVAATSTDPIGADNLIFPNQNADVAVVGVMRPYMVRHGVGPFPTENNNFFRGWTDTNKESFWQGPVRFGHLDIPMLRYAKSTHRPTYLAVSQMDILNPNGFFPVCEKYYHMEDCEPCALLPSPMFDSDEHNRKATQKLMGLKIASSKYRSPEEILDLIKSVAPVKIMGFGQDARDWVWGDSMPRNR